MTGTQAMMNGFPTRINPMIIEGQVQGGATEAYAITMG